MSNAVGVTERVLRATDGIGHPTAELNGDIFLVGHQQQWVMHVEVF